jgi:hypothetical protein
MLGVPPCIETVSGGSADALWPVTKDQILVERRLRVGRTAADGGAEQILLRNSHKNGESVEPPKNIPN